jgi:oxygen-independent coproporphyrinogen-3 oxidase
MTKSDPATSLGQSRETEVGSVFVSNYPPYSFWDMEHVAQAHRALAAPPNSRTPLGLYMHIPFCRKRCKFCYFKVYTEKNSQEVTRYLSALTREVELLASTPAIRDRPLKFVYVGGGTPSFISAKHLRGLLSKVKAAIPWDGVEEVTFECEPGTLTRSKLAAIREVGVTRLSLGVENFDDRILEENGRAHLSKEIFRVAPWIRALDFDQINIDLIAGMVGETWGTWKDSVQKTIEMDPDSVTVYQMELPFNTVYSRQLLDDSGVVPVADWALKRAWHDYAFAQFEQVGYEVSSAYTVVKKNSSARFVYRDSVWRGADLLGAGVASFSHVSGVHFQNETGWEPYLTRAEAGELPISRAYSPTPAERLTRELILQLKLGRIDPAYFQTKFDADILLHFRPALENLQDKKMLTVGNGSIRLSREGLLRVDSLLPEFYDPKYRNARYT